MTSQRRENVLKMRVTEKMAAGKRAYTRRNVNTDRVLAMDTAGPFRLTLRQIETLPKSELIDQSLRGAMVAVSFKTAMPEEISRWNNIIAMLIKAAAIGVDDARRLMAELTAGGGSGAWSAPDDRGDSFDPDCGARPDLEQLRVEVEGMAAIEKRRRQIKDGAA